jgi:hypothetical protein
MEVIDESLTGHHSTFRGETLDRILKILRKMAPYTVFRKAWSRETTKIDFYSVISGWNSKK